MTEAEINEALTLHTERLRVMIMLNRPVVPVIVEAPVEPVIVEAPVEPVIVEAPVEPVIVAVPVLRTYAQVSNRVQSVMLGINMTVFRPQPSMISIVNEFFDSHRTMTICEDNVLWVAEILSLKLKANNIADAYTRSIFNGIERARIAKEEEKHTTVLAKAALCAPCSDICAICLETHTKGNSVTTDCGHEFGKECWQTWSRQTHGHPSCGICRKKNPKVTMYRARRTRQVAQRRDWALEASEGGY
jgi:hypothetical protein